MAVALTRPLPASVPAYLASRGQAVTLPELAAVFRTTERQLDALVARHKVAPSYRIGHVRFYGLAEAARLFRLHAAAGRP